MNPVWLALLGALVQAAQVLTDTMLMQASMPLRPVPALCQGDFTTDLVTFHPTMGMVYNPAYPAHPEFGQCTPEAFGFSERVGQGAFGAVFRGFHRETNKIVALKVTNSVSMRRADVRKEECTMNAIRLPTIREHYCTYYDPAVAAVVLVMEYVEGVDMEAYLDEYGPPNPDVLQRWAAQLAVSIKAVQLRGFVLSDIKCANIMVADDETIKMIDFGAVQRAFERHPTNPLDRPIGSPLYWPPEYFPHPEVRCYSQPLADWWAYGLVLHTLATGREPYGMSEFDGLIDEDDEEGSARFWAIFVDRVMAEFQVNRHLREDEPMLADYLGRLLRQDASQRMGANPNSIMPALQGHPYLAPLRNALGGILGPMDL